MKVLACGDRHWTDRDLIAGYLAVLKDEHPDMVLCHGAASGADQIVGEEAEKLGIPVTAYPADWKRYGKAAGPIRNRRMLNEFRPDLICAFHDHIDSSKGTKDMIGLAQSAGLEIELTRHMTP